MKSDFKCKICKFSEQEIHRGCLEHSLLPWDCVERGRIPVVMDLIMGFASFCGAAVMHQALLYISSGLCSDDPCSVSSGCKF